MKRVISATSRLDPLSLWNNVTQKAKPELQRSCPLPRIPRSTMVSFFPDFQLPAVGRNQQESQVERVRSWSPVWIVRLAKRNSGQKILLHVTGTQWYIIAGFSSPFGGSRLRGRDRNASWPLASPHPDSSHLCSFLLLESRG